MALVLIGAPIDSVGRGGGAELGPVALRELGLAETLGASDRGDLEIRIRGDDRDPETGLIAADDVLAATAAIRSAVSERGRGRRPAAGPGRLLLGASRRNRRRPRRPRLGRPCVCGRPRRPLRRADVDHRRGRRHGHLGDPRARTAGLGRGRRRARHRGRAHLPDRLPRPRGVDRGRDAPAGGPRLSSPPAPDRGGARRRRRRDRRRRLPGRWPRTAPSGSTSTSTSSTRRSSRRRTT